MASFLIDANLPYYFELWRGDDYLHIFDLNDEWSDSDIWNYATEHDLTIVTKDTDFSDRIILKEPPPRVIHIRIGNMRMRDFHAFLNRVCARGPRTQQSLQTGQNLSRSCRVHRINKQQIIRLEQLLLKLTDSIVTLHP